MKKNIFIFLCGLTAPGMLLAESTDSLKTVAIEEVRFTRQRGLFYSEDHAVFNLAGKELLNESAATMGDLLRCKFPSLIKTYGGTGNLSTVSIRGTAADQTQVSWNGLPLNNATTGDVDLSVIPVFLADRISIIKGASGSIYGSGTFGGAIDIGNDLPASEKFSVSLINEVESFGSTFNAMQLRTASRLVHYQAAVYRKNARNDFKYYDSLLSSSRRISHNELKSFGIIQQLGLTFSQHDVLTLNAWYQDRQKNLPRIMGSPLGESFASQTDSSWKAFARYIHTGNRYSLTLKTAWFSDYLRYTDKYREDSPSWLVYSVFKVKHWYNDLGIRIPLKKHWVVDGALVSDQIAAEVLNYGHRVKENRLAALIASKYSLDNAVFNSSLRFERLPSGQIMLLPSIGGMWRMSTLFSWRANISRKMRQPTLNEKYWVPGGNPDIRPEEGWSGETGLVTEWKSGLSNLKFELSGYTSQIDDYILWTGEGGLLSPKNLRKVRTQGIEAFGSEEYRTGSVILSGEASWTLTKATILENEPDPALLNRQLRYVPLQAGSVTGSAQYGSLETSFNIALVGKRTTDEQPKTPVLAPYQLVNAWVGADFSFRAFDLASRFRVENLFNTAYQVVAYYPMPGRYFSLSLRFAFRYQ